MFSGLSLCLEICLECLRKRTDIVFLLLLLFLSFLPITEVRITRIPSSLLSVGEVTDVILTLYSYCPCRCVSKIFSTYTQSNTTH
jgi:hypothetical protein